MHPFLKVFSFLILFFISANSLAQENFGLGLIVGNPTGISGEINLSQNESLDFATAWSAWHYSGFHVHANYLVRQPRLTDFHQKPISLYYGLGGQVVFINSGKHNNKTAFGPRVPVGLFTFVASSRIKLFGELSLGLDLVPATEVNLGAAIGARYYF